MLCKKNKNKNCYFELPIIKQITIKDNILPPKDAFTAQEKKSKYGIPIFLDRMTHFSVGNKKGC